MSVDSSGNQKVDFAWGNVPMQPNDDREGVGQVTIEPANSDQNRGWSGTKVYPSELLNEALDNHLLVSTGHNGYPGYLPGDIDATPGDIPIPDLVGGTEEFAIAQWVAAGFKAENVNIIYLGNEQGANAQNNGKVASQNPEAGHTADVDHVITLEVYQAVLNTSVRYLVVGGGGGGGGGTSTNAPGGGGGGAGGFLAGFFTALPNVVYNIAVGNGGAGGPNYGNGIGSSGENSYFDSIVAAGGGFGGSASYTNEGTAGKGASGGSGGGGCASANDGSLKAFGNTPPTDPSQGNSGGVTNGSAGGGGGGAGAAGSDGYQTGNYANGQGGAGGNGLASDITGTAVTYAGGGGGGAYGDFGAESGGAGGVGGGGKGKGTSGNAEAGQANTGGGGGGSGSHSSYGGAGAGAAGGSGVVILRYPTTKTLTVNGGLMFSTTTVDTDYVTTFTSGSGTVSWN